jgi:hypothetical protein
MELIFLSLKVLLMFSTKTIIVIISIVGPVMLVLPSTVHTIVFFGYRREFLINYFSWLLPCGGPCVDATRSLI